MKFLTFVLNNQNYAIYIENVDVIIRIQDISKVPNTPPYIQGMINYLNKIYVIFDLKKRLNLEENLVNEINDDEEHNDDRKIIIYKYNQIGFLVDNTNTIIDCSEENIENADNKTFNNEFVNSIIKFNDKVYTVLNFEEVIKQC